MNVQGLKADLEEFFSRELQHPVTLAIGDDLGRGDLVLAEAMRLAGQDGRSPLVIAQELGERLSGSVYGPLVTVQIVAPGFVNIFLAQDTLEMLVADELARPIDAPLGQSGGAQTIVVEYSQPNIAKPMHFGHLRTTILGEAIKRLLSAVGFQAIGVNHLGDWGSQFGKLLAAYKRWGTFAELKAGGIGEMLRLYVKFHDELDRDPNLAADGAKEFAKLEQGDSENTALWQHMRDVSLGQFRAFYQRLGITMDEPEMGESDYVPALAELIRRALDSGVAEHSQGAIVIPVGEDISPTLIQKTDGATLYATRDLAAIDYRVKRWQPTKILYVVAADQSLHFRQVFRAAERLGLAGETELIHIPYGLVTLPEGKMSTRAGRVVFLEDVLQEAVVRARALITEKSHDLPEADAALVAEAIAVGALKYQVISQNRQTTITFDLEKMLNLQGNTAPYLQYAHARAQSILKKAGEVSEGIHLETEAIAEINLMRFAIRLPWVVERAAADYAPNILTDWLFELASQFNAYYEQHRILGESDPVKRDGRLAVTKLVAHQLRSGLNLLGIATPDRL